MTQLVDLKEGDIITLDDGFTCLKPGDHVVLVNANGPYVRCDDGLHYLDGQEDENGILVGVVQRKAVADAK